MHAIVQNPSAFASPGDLFDTIRLEPSSRPTSLTLGNHLDKAGCEHSDTESTLISTLAPGDSFPIRVKLCVRRRESASGHCLTSSLDLTGKERRKACNKKAEVLF